MKTSSSPTSISWASEPDNKNVQIYRADIQWKLFLVKNNI